MSKVDYLVGTNKFKIQKFLNNRKDDLVALSTWDLAEDNSDNINLFEDLSSFSLFTTKKLIIIKNAQLLEHKYPEQLPILINFIHQEEPDIELILLSDTPLSYQPNPNDAIYVDDFSEDELKSEVEEMVKNHGLSIEANARKSLIERLDGELFDIGNYIDIISNSIDTKIITLRNVEAIVPKKIEDKIYILTDALIKNHKNAYEIYLDLYRCFNKDMGRLLLSIAKAALNYILLIKYLDQQLSDDQIATKLNFKSSARVYMMRKDIKANTYELCCKLYHQLANLDYNLKSTGEFREVGLDLIILEYLNH
ncbi:MAG: hypothetical protein LBV55_04485 [Acholeplasmatales bacterium]|jgi:DNA polymerase III delta subunit|nr:hypothetical protein [Acholeplasmatales bacterium]